MGKYEVLTFAKSLGLLHDVSIEQDIRNLKVEETHRFFDCGFLRASLIATLRLDDQMNIVDYNNALAICMNTLKQYQSWS